MQTETASGLRHRGGYDLLPEDTPEPSGKRVRLRMANGESVDAKITRDEAATLRDVLAELRRVRKLTDPVVKKPNYCSLPTKHSFRPDHCRKETALTALDDLANVKTWIKVDHWFGVFVLLDRLGPKDQLLAFSDYFSRIRPKEDSQWALDVMRHWLIRRSTGGNAALRTCAVGLLTQLWKNAPHLQSATAELLAYLLCADPDIGRPVLTSTSDWNAVLKLLPERESNDEAETPVCLSKPELVITAGLLQGARDIDGARTTPAYLELLSPLLGKDLDREAPPAASLITFATALRHAESKSRICRKYNRKLSDYEEAQAAREARSRKTGRRQTRWGKGPQVRAAGRTSDRRGGKADPQEMTPHAMTAPELPGR